MSKGKGKKKTGEKHALSPTPIPAIRFDLELATANIDLLDEKQFHIPVYRLGGLESAIIADYELARSSGALPDDAHLEEEDRIDINYFVPLHCSGQVKRELSTTGAIMLGAYFPDEATGGMHVAYGLSFDHKNIPPGRIRDWMKETYDKLGIAFIYRTAEHFEFCSTDDEPNFVMAGRDYNISVLVLAASTVPSYSNEHETKTQSPIFYFKQSDTGLAIHIMKEYSKLVRQYIQGEMTALRDVQ